MQVKVSGRTNLRRNIIGRPGFSENLPNVKWYHIADANSPDNICVPCKVNEKVRICYIESKVSKHLSKCMKKS